MWVLLDNTGYLYVAFLTCDCYLYVASCMGPELLDHARSHLTVASALPYPERLTRSGHWLAQQAQTLEALLKMDSVESVVRAAQGGDHGFDHRLFDQERALHAVNFKLNEMSYLFPNFSLARFPHLTESKFSVEETLVAFGEQRFSSIFLTHLYFYLRTCSLTAEPYLRVCEIGSGYGGLARIFKLMQPNVQYVLCDLPESLFYAEVFLRANFPDARTHYVTDVMDPVPDAVDFVFVPAQLSDWLKRERFDLTVNTGSMQEMTRSAVHYWMDFIQQTIETRFFYSWNYFLNDKSQYVETKAGYNLISPILDEFWYVRYFRINEPLITVDADQRNWLEVCVERMSWEEQDQLDRREYVNALIDRANAHRAGTNYWFQNMWMAVWVNPAPSVVDAMLAGISFFAKNKVHGIQNFLEQEASALSEVKFYHLVKGSFSTDDPAENHSLPGNIPAEKDTASNHETPAPLE